MIVGYEAEIAAVDGERTDVQAVAVSGAQRGAENDDRQQLTAGLDHRGDRLLGILQQRLLHHQVLQRVPGQRQLGEEDRKSTRLNSSHVAISYAVFCLKKKID